MINVTLDLAPLINSTSAMLGTAKGFAGERFLKDIRWEIEKELELGFGRSADKAAKQGKIPHVYKPRDMDQKFNLISTGSRSDRLWAIVRKKVVNSPKMSTSNFEVVFIKNTQESPINPRIILGMMSDPKSFPRGDSLSRHIFPATAQVLERAKEIRAAVGKPSKHRVSGPPPKKIVGLKGDRPAFMQSYTRQNQYQKKFSLFASYYFNQQFSKGSIIMNSFNVKGSRVVNIIASETNSRGPNIPIPSMIPGFFIVDGKRPFVMRQRKSVVNSAEQRMSKLMYSQVKKATKRSVRSVKI
jgi:hypothetical protein